MEEFKVCFTCKELKPLTEFHKNGKGKCKGACKSCTQIYRRKLYELKHPDRIYKEPIPEGHAKCAHCKEIMPFTCFHEQRKHLDVNERDRYYYICKECVTEKRRNKPSYDKGTKVCSACGAEKPVAEFNKYYNGYMGSCRVCEKEYRERNKDKIKERKLRNKKPKTDKQRAKNSEWKRNNKEKVATQTRNRRARMFLMEGTHTAADIEDLYLEQMGKCPYCGSYLHIEGYHVDHIIPVSREELSPTNYPSNLQLLCVSCNTKKNNKTHEEFIHYLEIVHPENYNIYMEIYGGLSHV